MPCRSNISVDIHFGGFGLFRTAVLSKSEVKLALIIKSALYHNAQQGFGIQRLKVV